MKKNTTPPSKPLIPEQISVPSGTNHTTHDAYNMRGQTSSQISQSGTSISGRNSDTGENLQGRQMAEKDQRLKTHQKK